MAARGKPRVFPEGISIETLSTTLWGRDNFKDWGWEYARIPSAEFQKFERLNRKSLRFLGIDISQTDKGVALTTSKFAGYIPIYSPKNGATVGDLAVLGRYSNIKNDNVTELLSLIGGTLKVEYCEDLPLYRKPTFRAPILMECCQYIDAYIEAERYRWQKFDNVIQKQRMPSGSTQWAEYAERNARDPFQFDIFKNKHNILTTNHNEWWQLNYVLSIAIEEVDSFKVSQRTRMAYLPKITKLRQNLTGAKQEKTDTIRTSVSDPSVIKELKMLARCILERESKSQIAWRFDYAEFFERYVQYLCEQIAKEKGFLFDTNKKISFIGSRPTWSLRYLEPDIVMRRNNTLFIVDAKYKSHMFNITSKKESVEKLMDEFRHDIHQVLAYTTLFREYSDVHVMLAYPISDDMDVVVKKQTLNKSSNSPIKIHLVGVPMQREKVNAIIKELGKEFIM